MRRVVGLLRHPVVLFGVALTTASAALFLSLFVLDLAGFFANPYVGLLIYVVLPLLFALGLVLVAAGAALERRRPERGRERWPRIDLNDPVHRRAVGLLLAATFANLVILAMGASGGIEYMESRDFCGQVCHAPMQPQFVSHQASPHARVSCAACHVGPGALPFVEAKVKGTRQLYQVLTATYHRPIRVPGEGLRPARETCERCHWPGKFHGDVLLEHHEYAPDEPNTASVTRLRLHVGGGSERLGVATGIHWHMNLAHVVEYLAADDQRLAIPYVRVTDPDGDVREYLATGFARGDLEDRALRRMDCMDCHNRAAHPLAATPERAVDQAIAMGRISHEVPYIRREAVAALAADYPDGDAAGREIARRLRDFYERGYPELAEGDGVLARTIRVTQELWAEHVFPEMRVTWGTYPNHIGHTDAPGCFRCHDEDHRTDDGRVLGQDCESCHAFE